MDARIVSAYSAGCSLKDAAERCGVSVYIARKALRAAGMTIRKGGFGSLTPERRIAISRLGGASVPAHRRAYARDRDLAKTAGAAGGRISRGGGRKPRTLAAE